MLCVECGIREAKYDNLCEICFRKKVKFTAMPPHMEVTVCPHCGSVRLKGEWKKMSFEEMIEELIERNVEFLHDYDSYTFEFKYREESEGYLLDVTFHIKYRDLQMNEEHVSRASIHYESCPRCNRYFGNYFEAILQLRGMREGELYEVLEYAHRRIEHYAAKNENLFVTKEEGKKEGWDIYLSDKREAKKIAKEICEKYGAVLKESPQIAGRRDGRDMYRVTYSVRLPSYRAGDVLRIEGVYYLLESVNRSVLHLLSLRDARRKTVDTKKHRVEAVYPQYEFEEGLVVFSRNGNLQIMDSQYRVMETQSPFIFENGKKIRFVRIDEEVYVLPCSS